MSHQQPELPIFQRMRVISFVKSEPEKFTPCRNPFSSTNMPLFMDNPVQNHLSSIKLPLFMDKTSNSAALSIKRADFMDTLRILICAVHGNEAFDGQRANQLEFTMYVLHLSIYFSADGERTRRMAQI